MKVDDIRQFQIKDLLWIEPLAKKLDSWEVLLNNLNQPTTVAFVVEPLCIVYLYADHEGMTTLAAVLDHSGIKPFMRITKILRHFCDENGIIVRGYWGKDSWATPIGEQNGFHWYEEKKIYIRFPNVKEHQLAS